MSGGPDTQRFAPAWSPKELALAKYTATIIGSRQFARSTRNEEPRVVAGEDEECRPTEGKRPEDDLPDDLSRENNRTRTCSLVSCKLSGKSERVNTL
ncbi:hypothetical protein J6590_007089 [Homalodisca vitripennis]|nr:hypothetical protein J6590_007089 [Homalodisca vitripennis]